jgi:predicted nucleotidyltransferase/HEPN domain-containing protein
MEDAAPLSFSDLIDHLPESKRRELTLAAQILFDAFAAAQNGKLSEKKKDGRILKLILFGSYARGDWVEDPVGGYFSDFDLLVVVNSDTFAEPYEYWDLASERLLREETITHRLKTPVNFIVHSLRDLNNQLALGRPFFIDIARDGIVLYEAAGFPLATAKVLAPGEIEVEARRHFEHWFPSATYFLKLANYAVADAQLNHAAFNLHQATEHLYHAALLTLTLYSPKLHRLKKLRSFAESLDARLIDAWPRDTKFARRSFSRLDRAYVDARYSPKYEITGEELAWLMERVKVLTSIVETICTERLGNNS